MSDEQQTEKPQLKTYKGGCHCRRFEFEYSYPSFEEKPPAVCNCSYCIIQDGILTNSPEEDNPLKWTKGSPEETAKYEWNSKQITWHFCQTCGVILVWEGFGCIGVNARCLDEFAQLDPKAIKLDKFDGANLIPGDSPAKLGRAGKEHDEPGPVLSPQYDASASATVVDTSKLPSDYAPGTELIAHKGGCHCRKFEFDYDYPYLDVLAPTLCNCSFCYIQGVLLAYNKEENDFKPLRWTKGSVSETTGYSWNIKDVTWHFCPTCGSLLLWTGNGAKTGEMGVNVRCFDNFAQVDVDKLTLRTDDGASLIPGVPPAKRQATATATATAAA